MTTFGALCTTLRRQGHTLDEIVQLTGRPKTSVYHYIRGIPLSDERKQAWRLVGTERIVAHSQARKGKSFLGRHPTAFTLWTPKHVLLIAHMSFDGSISGRGCFYSNRSKQLIKRVRHLMRILYPYRPAYSVDKKTGVLRISYFNVELGAYIKEKREDLTRTITGMDTECKCAYLKAFFDDEGCVDFRPSRNVKRVRGYQKRNAVLSVVRQLLADFGIQADIKHPNEIMISGHQNLISFSRHIGFSPGVRVNGKRTNSIWKRSLEKRELLQMAIASYKCNAHAARNGTSVLKWKAAP